MEKHSSTTPGYACQEKNGYSDDWFHHRDHPEWNRTHVSMDIAVQTNRLHGLYPEEHLTPPQSPPWHQAGSKWNTWLSLCLALVQGTHALANNLYKSKQTCTETLHRPAYLFVRLDIACGTHFVCFETTQWTSSKWWPWIINLRAPAQRRLALMSVPFQHPRLDRPKWTTTECNDFWERPLFTNFKQLLRWPLNVVPIRFTWAWLCSWTCLVKKSSVLILLWSKMVVSTCWTKWQRTRQW